MKSARIFAATLTLLTMLGASAFAHAQASATQDSQAAAPEEKWPGLKKALFGEREVREDGGEVLQLSVRIHPESASVVPVRIQAAFEQKADRYIRYIYLVIDENPSPFGARFTLTPESGRADIETRVRVENRSPVHAVAELNDGSLWMQSAFVDAAGGCTAAFFGGGGQSEDALGTMQLRVDNREFSKHDPVSAQLIVAHPQFSGMTDNDDIPAHFVRQVNVYYADRLVLTADMDFTISRNPSLRFYFTREGEGELRAEVIDSTDLRFEKRLLVHAPQ
ncbi:MAG TPA: quinoprotein dehydrogenase-associated SoxYZ-like carrier [Burkholderiales bacterium]|nr:quinoprotein dehydrogenase-associated SoxYZ-like carrier [Burkholderiales bacterium]